MSLTLDQSAVTSRQVSVESKFGLGDPLAQLDQEMDNDKDDDCGGQDANASPSNQTRAVLTIAPVSMRSYFEINMRYMLTGLGRDTHRSVESCE